MAGSISQRAKAKAPVQEPRDRSPDWVVRAKAGRVWIGCGVAWNRTNGEGISIRLNALPIDFDGTLKVLLPLVSEEEAEQA